MAVLAVASRGGATGRLVAGSYLILASAASALLLPTLVQSGGAVLSAVFYATASVELVVGLLLMRAGIRRALSTERRLFRPTHAYTLGILSMGALFLLFSLPDPRYPDLAAPVAALFGVLAFASFAVAVLRIRASPLAAATTSALGFFLAPFFPFGTGMFLWWRLSVRKREVGSGAA